MTVVSLPAFPARPVGPLRPLRLQPGDWMGIAVISSMLLLLLAGIAAAFIPGVTFPTAARLSEICRQQPSRERWLDYQSFAGVVQGPAGPGRAEDIEVGPRPRRAQARRTLRRTSNRTLIVAVAGQALPVLLHAAPAAAPGEGLAFCGRVEYTADWRPEVGYVAGRFGGTQYGPVTATYLQVKWKMDLQPEE